MRRKIIAALIGAVLAYFVHDAIGGRYYAKGYYRTDGMTGTVTRKNSPDLVYILGEYSVFAEFKP